MSQKLPFRGRCGWFVGLGALMVGMLVRAWAADPSAVAAHPLSWDALAKSVEAEPGSTTAGFTFSVTNTAPSAVEITEIQPSCGCTTVRLPAMPWRLEPGETGAFGVTVNFGGKDGQFSKTIRVTSAAGPQILHVTVNIPDTPEARRERNRQMASLDRQAVFRGDCATCHVAPTVGKTGEALFQAACFICHGASPRATTVPDLLVARERRDADYWRRWIGEGKTGTLMPAFAASHGGPLTDAQVTSLVDFALRHLPTAPPR